jgi:hypothetical protein
LELSEGLGVVNHRGGGFYDGGECALCGGNVFFGVLGIFVLFSSFAPGAERPRLYVAKV